MTWIPTYTGRIFHLTNPRPEDVSIEDIAHALSRVCRFTGHATQFYSVAQHSVHVARQLPDALKLAGLLHDAGEAYYGDISRPLKLCLRNLTTRSTRVGPLCEFDAFLDRIDAAIAARFGLAHPLPPEVQHADDTLLAAEARDLMSPLLEAWAELPPPLPATIVPWDASRAEKTFLRHFYAYATC